MKSFFHLFSFGNRYVSATFFYLGLGFILFAVTPELPQSFAQCDSCETGCGGEEPCEEGLVCQDGECVCPDN